MRRNVLTIKIVQDYFVWCGAGIEKERHDSTPSSFPSWRNFLKGASFAPLKNLSVIFYQITTPPGLSLTTLRTYAPRVRPPFKGFPLLRKLPLHTGSLDRQAPRTAYVSWKDDTCAVRVTGWLGDLGFMRGDRGSEERRMQEWYLAEG